MAFGLRKKKPRDQPSQKELKSTCLRPGRKVDLVLQADLEKDYIDVRSTILHDVTKKEHLVLAQPSPRVSRLYKGEPIEVSFLVRMGARTNGRWMRMGYRAPVLEMLENYELDNGMLEAVLVVEGPRELKKHTLRLSYRLEPPPEKDLKLYVMPQHEAVNIIDISVGGVKITHPREMVLDEQGPVPLLLANEDAPLALQGELVRSQDLPSARGIHLTQSALRFVNLSPRTRLRLSRLLQELSRYELAKRSGLLPKEHT